MPHPEAPVESISPNLGSPLDALLQRSELREVLRSALQIQDLRGAVGLPRRVSAEVAVRWLAGPHVLVSLADSAGFDARQGQLAIPVEQAAALVDRVLGGSGSSGVASQLGALSDAECGVLAYLAASCARAAAPGWRVCDVVSVSREQLPAWPSEAVIWPMQVSASGDLRLDLKLVLPRACCSLGPQRVTLSVPDELTPSALADLRAGDLLTFESWSLHVTTRGAAGLLELRALGSRERLSVTLSGLELALSTAVPVKKRGANEADLVVGELELELWELAALTSGARIVLPEQATRSARLEFGGRTVAQGTLVRYRGNVALRIEELTRRDSAS